MIRRLAFVMALVPALAWLPGAAQEKSNTPEIVHRLKGHADAVYAAAYSPDGKLIATASFDSTIKLWDASTGKEIKTYAGTAGHTKQVIAIAFSKDGTMLASGSTDNTLKVWDVPVNTPIRSLKAGAAVHAVALSPDGLKLAIGGKDGALKLVTPAEFKELVKFEAGHQGAINALSFSANGQVLASVGADRTLRYWNVADGKLLATIGAHLGSVNNVAINPNSSATYTVGDDGFLKFWQMPPIAPSRTLPGHAGPIRAIAVTPDNATYYTGSDDRTVRQFGIAGAKEMRALTGPQAGVLAVATHPQNAYIAAGTADSRVFLWNNADPKVPMHWLAHAGTVHSVQMATPTTLMSAGGDGLIKYWNIPQNAPRAFVHPEAVTATSASPDGKKLFTGSTDKIVRIWDATKQAIEKQLPGHTGPVTALAVSPNLAIFASGSADSTIRLWNQAAGKESDILLAHAAPVTALGINPAGTQMLSASEDGTVKLWALPLVAPKPFVHPDQVALLQVTADGTKMVTAGNDKVVRLWNLASGAKERDFAAPAALAALAISNNGALIASAVADKTVTLWNAGDAKIVQKLAMPANAQAVVFSADAQSIFVGLADGAIRHIKVADGKEIKAFPPQHKATIVAMSLSPKGDMLYSASADKTIQSWALPDGTPKAKLEHAGPIVAMALSRDGTRIAAVADKVVKAWTTADGKEAGSFKAVTDIKAIALAPDGTRIALGGADKVARVHEPGGALLEQFSQDGPVQAVAFLDAKKVITGGADKVVRLWSSSLLWHKQHQGPVRQALFTAKADQIVSTGDDKAIRIWNAADGKEVKSLTSDSPITHLSLSADATKIATAGADKVVKLWTVAEGKTAPPITLPAAAQGLTLSPNGQRIAVAVADGAKNVIRVHDVAAAKDVQVFEDHTAPLKAVQFLGDNRTLLTASADKTAKLLDVNIAAALAAHPAGATFAQYSANGAQLLTAGADKTIKLWDVAKSNVVKTFGPVADPIKAIAFSKDFNRIGVAAGKSVKVFTVADGKEVVTLTHPADVLALSFNPDNTRIATGASDKQTRLWDIASGKELQYFAQDDTVNAVVALPSNVFASAAGKATRLDTSAAQRVVAVDAGSVHALAVVPANTHVLTGGADKIAKLWNVSTGAKEKEFSGAAGPIRSVAITKNALLVAIGGNDGTMRIHQFADAKEIGAVKLPGDVRAVSFTPNNVAVVASTSNQGFGAWTVPFTAGQPTPKDFLTPVQLWTPPGLLADFAIAGDSATIYSAGQDNAMHVWKLASPAPTRNFPHPNAVDAVAFQPDTSFLMSASHDGQVRIFDLVKNNQVKAVNAHISVVNKNNVGQAIYSLTFTPDGKQFLTSSLDNSMKLWDAAGNMVKEFKAHKEKEFEKGHQEAIYTAGFSPDGKFIASGSSGLERTIKIWNLDGSVARDLANPAFKTIPGFPPASHPGAVSSLRFTRDGKLISVGDAPGNKGYLAIWDWQAGKMLYENTAQLGVFYGLALAPDEKTLVVTAGNRDRKGASPEYNAAYVMKMPGVK